MNTARLSGDKEWLEPVAIVYRNNLAKEGSIVITLSQGRGDIRSARRLLSSQAKDRSMRLTHDRPTRFRPVV